jgi:hypothetical protein
MVPEYKCKIDDPEQVRHHWDDNNREWLTINIQGYQLEVCDTLWIRTYRAKRGRGELIPPLLDNLTKENSLRFPHCPERLQQPEAESPLLLPSSDRDTVWLGLDVHDIDRYVEKDLSKIQFLLIPCSALEAARITSFEDGCTPSASR